MITFNEVNAGYKTNMDTEGSEPEPITVNGASALLSEKDSMLRIAWSYADRYFVVEFSGTGGKEEAHKIAESVIKIK